MRKNLTDPQTCLLIGENILMMNPSMRMKTMMRTRNRTRKRTRMKLLAMGKNLTDPQICLLIGENIPTHRHHQDSYDESKVEEEDDDEEEDETVGDQSVLKYHISLPAEKIAAAAGGGRWKKLGHFFRPDLTLNKSMINIPRTLIDVFGGAVCRIGDRAKIKTTRIDANVKSNLRLFRTFLIVVRMEVKRREFANKNLKNVDEIYILLLII